MKSLIRLSLGTALAVFVFTADRASAADCDYMVGEINELLKTTELSQEQKDQVMQLRDQGQAESGNGPASGDCEDTLQQALDILNAED